MNERPDHESNEAAPAVQSPGAQLKAARERAGWTEERLAAELCLPVARLRALEADDHSTFGGVVFVRGYLRRAAALLGLAPEPLIAAYERCCTTVRPAQILPGLPPGRLPRRGAPAWLGPMAGLFGVVAVIGTTWWLLAPVVDTRASGTAATQPRTGLEFSVPEAAPPVVVAESPPPVVVAESAPPAELPPALLEVLGEMAPGELAQARVVEVPAPATRVVEDPEPAAPPPGTVELRFEFTEDCWLEVADADERRLAYRLYRAGDVARLRGKAPVSVFLGNAEGVRLTVDGSAIAVRPAARRDGTARLTVGGGAG